MQIYATFVTTKSQINSWANQEKQLDFTLTFTGRVATKSLLWEQWNGYNNAVIKNLKMNHLRDCI